MKTVKGLVHLDKDDYEHCLDRFCDLLARYDLLEEYQVLHDRLLQKHKRKTAKAMRYTNPACYLIDDLSSIYEGILKENVEEPLSALHWYLISNDVDAMRYLEHYQKIKMLCKVLLSIMRAHIDLHEDYGMELKA